LGHHGQPGEQIGFDLGLRVVADQRWPVVAIIGQR